MGSASQQELDIRQDGTTPKDATAVTNEYLTYEDMYKDTQDDENNVCF